LLLNKLYGMLGSEMTQKERAFYCHSYGIYPNAYVICFKQIESDISVIYLIELTKHRPTKSSPSLSGLALVHGSERLPQKHFP